MWYSIPPQRTQPWTIARATFSPRAQLGVLNCLSPADESELRIRTTGLGRTVGVWCPAAGCRSAAALNKAFQLTLDEVQSKFPYWSRTEGRDHVFIFPTERGPAILTDANTHRIRKVRAPPAQARSVPPTVPHTVGCRRKTGRGSSSS